METWDYSRHVLWDCLGAHEFESKYVCTPNDPIIASAPTLPKIVYTLIGDKATNTGFFIICKLSLVNIFLERFNPLKLPFVTLSRFPLYRGQLGHFMVLFSLSLTEDGKCWLIY